MFIRSRRHNLTVKEQLALCENVTTTAPVQCYLNSPTIGQREDVKVNAIKLCAGARVESGPSECYLNSSPALMEFDAVQLCNKARGNNEASKCSVGVATKTFFKGILAHSTYYSPLSTVLLKLCFHATSADAIVACVTNTKLSLLNQIADLCTGNK